MSDPVTARSDNILDITVSRRGAPVNDATVTVSVNSPSGGQTLTTTSVPFVANGLYEINTGPAVWPVDGTFKTIWIVTDSNGKVKHTEQAIVVVK